jgi:hypothetical protein
MKTKTLLLNLLILAACSACIDDYDYFNIYENQRGPILLVNGLLTNDTKNPDTLKFQYSTDFGAYITTKPIAGVKASLLLSSTGKEISLNEIKTGAFLPPIDFKLNTSEKYTLKFTINNQQYESTQQQINSTPPIANISNRFNERSRLSADGKRISSANEIFLDYQDSPKQRNYYLWRYIHYERLTHCVTCDAKSLYYRDRNGCRYFAELNNPPYDYGCDGKCYSIFRDRSVNISDDQVSDGRLVTNTLIAKIPLYTFAGCLVEVQQMCLSPDVYAYHKVLKAQQNTGGLADTPPTAIVGNIRNINNSQERIVGFFGVVEIQKERYWLSRDNAKGNIEPIFGRPIVEEPQGTFGIGRPPLAPCLLSSSRTPITPEGWR